MAHDNVEEIASDIASGLPAFYPKSEDSPNYKAIIPAAEQAALLETDISDVRHAIRVQDEMGLDLTIHRGKTYTVKSDTTKYRDTVDVNGVLEIEGLLLAREINVGTDGEIVVGDKGELVQEGNLEEFIQRLEKLGAMVQVYPYDGESISHYRARIIAEFSLMTAEGTFEDLLTLAVEVLDVSPESLFINDRLAPGEAEIQVPAQGLQNTDLSESELADVLERVLPASYSLSALQRGTFTYITPSQYDLNDQDASKGYDGLDANGDPKDNGGTYAGLIT